MHSILIADYIITKSHGQLTPLQIINLVFISHGYTLALTNKPLISEPVEAWKYGPIIPSLYHALSKYGTAYVMYTIYDNVDIRMDPDHEKLLRDKLGNMHEIVDRVMNTHDHLSGSELSRLTHKKGTPWRKYYTNDELGAVMPDGEIRKYYKKQMA